MATILSRHARALLHHAERRMAEAHGPDWEPLERAAREAYDAVDRAPGADAVLPAGWRTMYVPDGALRELAMFARDDVVHHGFSDDDELVEAVANAYATLGMRDPWPEGFAGIRGWL